MQDALIDATYESNWSSLVGCLQAMLRQAGLPHDAARVSAVTGEAFRIPEAAREGAPAFALSGYAPRPLDGLAADLALLGRRARVDAWDLRRRRPALLGTRVGRRLRGALSRGWAVAAYGAVEGEFGLLVTYDAGRRAYRVRGPLSDEMGGWLRADRMPVPDATWLALVSPERGEAPVPAAIAELVGRAAQHRLGAGTGDGLSAWIGVLRSAREIDERGHARAAQALAAAAGEAARFWRAAAAEGVDAAAALVDPSWEQSLALSRFATLFPFPMGGDLAAGGREMGARALSGALEWERRLEPLLPAIAESAPERG